MYLKLDSNLFLNFLSELDVFYTNVVGFFLFNLAL